MPSLLGPAEAGQALARRLSDTWPDLVCRELVEPRSAVLECKLRPGVSSSADIDRLGIGVWNAWREAWRRAPIGHLPGADLVMSDIRVQGASLRAPALLRVAELESAGELLRALGCSDDLVDVARALRVGSLLRDREAELTPRALRRVAGLPDGEVELLCNVVSWLRENPDLQSWTERELPIPGVHTKWLKRHAGLVTTLVRRTVRAEVRPRPAVVHFSYADPDYLAGGGRRHDAWTSGDVHSPAYPPRVVLIVENRDCRLGFPEIPGVIVVEGEGKAAASVAAIEWVRAAERLIYWGDIDSDGFGILNSLRAALKPYGRTVTSLLMDEVAFARYARFGVDRDRRGELLKPSRLHLPELTESEAGCYAQVATEGEAAVRRIEQERIPRQDALHALHALLGR